MDQETLVRKHSNEFKNITNLLLKKYPDIEMIFFLPNFRSETEFNYNDYTLFISAKSFDDIYDFDVYLKIFNLFNDNLTDKENDLISRITKFNTDSNERQSIKKFIRNDSSLVNLKDNYLNNIKLPDGLLTLSL
ncbi:MULTISPECIES: hypothetical protein [Staphylococcus]|uniref:Uncharacterized protein n=1 Tax=Staphylococcus ureilyticus TaxID=94138 RepID=A0AB34AF14_STAUR|nr:MULTISPECIES: hypothetical protein [Staphylococcus]QKU17341.1 hypothetical protein FOC52_00395 [Staphylococcus cohnii]MCT1914096.1 hypothetical protein [Staphylococcus ureilyticus]MDU9372759.1 hypothetical protein [Staphylococcus ureilyticus]PNZ40184.1 hypothetical protein CD150_12230 [Staphylococcus ureilyticus]GEQ01871.1 hypothetical protein SCO02_03120 [Staphylococcus ureilyticus]